MRLLKLFAVLAATIVSYLVLLHFKVSFGIALIIAMAIMWYGVKYVRQQHPETEEYAEEPVRGIDHAADGMPQASLPDQDESAEESLHSGDE